MARGDFLKNMTPEQMAEFQRKRVEKMRANKAAKVEQKREVLKVDNYPISDYTDKVWAGLASDVGVRLCHRSTPLSTGRMTQFLRELRIPVTKFNEWTGLNLEKYVEYNETFPLRAAMGTALEHRAQILESA